jgi:hypothetical protein
MISKENGSKILADAKRENLKKIQDYVYSKKCRRQFILEYLGLSKSYFAYNGFTCTKCDNCTKHNLTDITTFIWDHYLQNKPLNNRISNIINDKDFNVNKILKDWASYVEFKNYSQFSIPENLKIKLRLPDNFIESKYDLIYEKYKDLEI